MKLTVSILFFLFILPSGFTQNFDTDDTVKYVQHEVTSITPAHEYFQLYNLLGDSLPMRWRVNQSLTFYPPQWSIALQDNMTYHNPMIDSSDFILPDTVGAMDKIIINVSPNGTLGYGEIVIDLINLDSVAETIRIKFEIEIIPDQIGILENNLENNTFSVYPNPTKDIIHLKIEPINANYILTDINGKCVETGDFKSTENPSISVANLPDGVYFILLRDSNSKESKVRFVKAGF